MGRRGPTKHLKRINAPKHWMLDKLGGIFVSFFLRLRERALVFVACLGEGNCLGSGGGARGLLRTRGLSGAARRNRIRASVGSGAPSSRPLRLAGPLAPPMEANPPFCPDHPSRAEPRTRARERSGTRRESV